MTNARETSALRDAASPTARSTSAGTAATRNSAGSDHGSSMRISASATNTARPRAAARRPPASRGWGDRTPRLGCRFSGARSGPADRWPPVAFGSCPSPTSSRPCVDALPPDWSQLEADLRIDDEDRYIEAATLLSQINAMPYSQARLALAPAIGPRVRSRRRAQTVRGTLALLDDQGITGTLAPRERAPAAWRSRRCGAARVGAPGVRPPPRRSSAPVARVALICPDPSSGRSFAARSA